MRTFADDHIAEQSLAAPKTDEAQPEAAALNAGGQLALERIRDEAQAGGEPTPKQKAALHKQFERAKTVEEKCVIVTKRFGVRPEAIDRATAPDVMRLYTTQSAPWDVAGLERLWAVLERLPYAHLAGIATVSRHKAERTTGMMDGATLAIGFDSGANAQTVGQADAAIAPALAAWYGKDVPADQSILAGENKIEKTLTHEIGHNVASMLGTEEGYCATKDGGGWKVYREPAQIGSMLSEAFGLDAHLDAQQLAELGNLLRWSAQYWDGEFDVPRLMSWWKTLSTAGQSAVRAAFDIIGSLFGGPPRWMLDDGAQLVRDARVYQYDGQAGGFMSYDVAARAKRVSNYQMKGAGEWFAEAYAAYYAPDPGGPGALLGRRDPATKKWMDENLTKKK